MTNKNRPLWAPWRIEYIRSEKDGNCFLCIPAEYDDLSDLSSFIIFRGKTVFVILNRYPYNSGHLMVVPYRHINDTSLLTEEEMVELMTVTNRAKKCLQNVMNPDGFNIGFNIGIAAGAGLEDHIHMHIVPRWIGDTNFMPVLGDARVMPEALKETAIIIKENWS